MGMMTPNRNPILMNSEDSPIELFNPDLSQLAKNVALRWRSGGQGWNAAASSRAGDGTQVMESHEVEINGKTFPVRSRIGCGAAGSGEGGAGVGVHVRLLTNIDKQNENRSKLLMNSAVTHLV
jgi:hypothetical protein